jgi:hypothetical protein
MRNFEIKQELGQLQDRITILEEEHTLKLLELQKQLDA